MGLLDTLGSDDVLGGLLSAGAASGAKGNFLSRMAQGLQAGDKFSQGRREEARQRSQDEMRAEYQKLMQMKMQRDMQQQEAAAAKEAKMSELAGRFSNPGMPGMGGFNGSLPPEMQVPNVPGKAPSFDFNGYANALAGIDPQAGFDMQQKLKPKEKSPISVAPGAALLDPTTFKPVFQNPKEDSVPSAIKEYQFAKEQGYPGTYQQWTLENKKAGATSITNSINTEKPLLNSIASGLGKQIDDSFANAKGAVSSIGTAQRLKSAVDSGKLVSGPGASFRVLGLQLGQMLGVGGKDGAEILSNTRTAIQSMAQAELDAAQQMKGQGQITEAERVIIKRAAAGDINDLTGPEMRLLADTMEKIGRFKLKNHQNNVQALGKMPGAAALMPFYQIEAPPEYQAPASKQGRVRRFNPATGKIE